MWHTCGMNHFFIGPMCAVVYTSRWTIRWNGVRQHKLTTGFHDDSEDPPSPCRCKQLTNQLPISLA